VVVVRDERAGLRRRSDGAARPAHVLRHHEPCPRDEDLRASPRDKRMCAFRELRMLRKKGLDASGAGWAEAGDAGPPAPAPGHTQRQIGQRADARCVQRPYQACTEPPIDGVANEWHGRRHPAKRLDCGQRRLDRAPIGGAGRTKSSHHVRPRAAGCERHEHALDLRDRAARGCAGGSVRGQLAVHRPATGHPLQPGSKRRQLGLVGPRGWVRPSLASPTPRFPWLAV
jgi:hypothetical protein